VRAHHQTAGSRRARKRSFPRHVVGAGAKLFFPIAITNPPALPDFGATVSSAAVVTAAKQLLATFDVSPQAGAKEAVYVISLAPISSVGVSTDSTCAMPTDSSIAASFTLTQRSAKASKK